MGDGQENILTCPNAPAVALLKAYSGNIGIPRGKLVCQNIEVLIANALTVGIVPVARAQFDFSYVLGGGFNRLREVKPSGVCHFLSCLMSGL
jgi:hypothetical protein